MTLHAWLMTLAVDPCDGILSLVWVVGIYAIIAGIAELVFAFRVHNAQEGVSRTVSRMAS